MGIDRFSWSSSTDHVFRKGWAVQRVWKSLGGLVLFVLAIGSLFAQEHARVPWTTSRVEGSPDPPAPYQVRRTFPKLQFQNPVDLCYVPPLDRFFLAEQGGKVLSFRNDPAASETDLFCDLAPSMMGLSALYGIAFHPGFATNQVVYLCYVLKDGAPDGSRVSQFSMLATDPPRLDLKSEKIIITWLGGGHNGGSLQFGLDGFLYISTGDGGGPNPPDPLMTGQDLKDLLSSVLRIDVTAPGENRPYRVPADNPFVHLPEARPEVWAYGLRNPWRMSVDKLTGTLWTADVGWELWETVYRIERGGNYGWSITEGPQPIHTGAKRGPTPIIPPLRAHPHTEAASITGGCVYRGHLLSELVGAYCYGDWVTGKLWALREQTNAPALVEELVDTSLQVVCFAPDSVGELLVVDYAGGVYTLERNTVPRTERTFPARLSETGLFVSTPNHRLAPGVIPFDINAPMWSDGATAERFLGLPGDSQIDTGATNVWVYQTKNEWRYPTNAVLGKTLSLAVQAGPTASRRRLETQLLHFDGLDWHAYSYRWNESQTDALLVDSIGDELTVPVPDVTASDGKGEQTWRFHSRAECLRCHNPWVNVALAFTGAQLNRPRSTSAATTNSSIAVDSASANQLRWLSRQGYFDRPLGESARPVFADPYDTAADLGERARAWLHVNCSHCHREGAGGSVVSHFDYDTRLSDMKAVGRPPSQGSLGLQHAAVIAAQDPASSVLYYRIASTGQGRMPLIGSRRVDVDGLRLLHDWISSLGQPSPSRLNSTVAKMPSAETLSGWPRDPLDLAQQLTDVNRCLDLVATLDHRTPHLPDGWQEVVAGHPAPHVHDLLDRFLALQSRRQVLGANFRPEEILTLAGERERGRVLFFRDGVQCSRCHRIGNEGRDFGPDLTLIGRKYTREQLLEQIFRPSARIDEPFVSYQIETSDDNFYTGFLVRKSQSELVLKDSELHEVHLPAAHVKRVQSLTLSAMPEGLLQSLTAAEAADLLQFLSSLR